MIAATRLLRAACAGALVALAAAPAVLADKTHSQTSRANRLYDREQYDKALEIYDQTLLEAPQEHRLHATAARPCTSSTVSTKPTRRTSAPSSSRTARPWPTSTTTGATRSTVRARP